MKVTKGIHADQIAKESSFYKNAVQSSSIIIVSDARKDERINGNVQVTDGNEVGFFALAPLVTQGGERIGALRLLDPKPGKSNILRMEGDCREVTPLQSRLNQGKNKEQNIPG